MTTLYEWAGGEPAIRRLMDAFSDRVEGDELLSPFFGDLLRANKGVPIARLAQSASQSQSIEIITLSSPRRA